ncbi:hypothetical protein DXT99_05295 [Pontibacter diazotrophicus]|uniref:Uncharacterized protein n=1 Tax=Pontibacter diazotrophicus TaxID=1400979 RepID=A0A3D8LFB3_9BACT|nr:hypothetical protein [Pontibacter diazotrophicus]RDV16087.1 hypothetical protein DXT99_05295 [Pontibacter diazotrophicus]
MAMLTSLSLLFPLFFTYMLAVGPSLRMQQDLEQDFARLEKDNRYFISDNSTQTPSVETVANDLQLFQLAASLDLSKANHSSQTIGNHQVDIWQLTEGDIKSIYQIESNIHLDTVVTQRYLDNRPPTQQRITNDFTFRSYAVSTATEPLKFYYLTEEDQGLLSYHLGDKQVEITYAATKEGLADVLQGYKEEVKQLMATPERY